MWPALDTQNPQSQEMEGMKKRLILIGPQEAEVLPGEERAVQLGEGHLF